MKMFEILEPRSVEEACHLLSRHGDQAKVLAGGTALVKLMGKKLVHPSYLINIKGIKELDFVREGKEGLEIGALATLADIENSSVVKEKFLAVAEMIHTIGSVQIRNVGTLAGNLCFADPASDPAPLLIALEAKLKIADYEKERIVPSEEFFTDFYETALAQHEIVQEIWIPFLPEHSGAVYLKHMMRRAFDLAIVGVAVLLCLNSKLEICQKARIIFGGVSSTPIRATKVEALLTGKTVDDALIGRAARVASEIIDPIHDVRASAEYRKEMVGVFAKKGIEQALARAKGR
jgi:CO/xanthine dehydrogenase FAD-binding subunit